MSAPSPEVDRRAADRIVPAGPPAILIVDDSVAIRRLLRRALEQGGYSVTEACDGSKALDACRESRPDLVLLDVDMPVMDGHVTLRAMRADPELRSVPVFFLTARTGGADVAVGLELGAEDYLRKPCEAAELTARVGMTLRRKAQEAVLARQAAASDELSTTDTLTGLGNRRRLELWRTKLATLRGQEARLGVLIIDIDHFKRVNDEHGHPVGDAVLKIVAARLSSAVADPVTLGRWGGEEFLVLAPGVETMELVALGEDLRARMSSSPCCINPGELIQVTVSVGCSPGRLGDFDATVASADEALYEAKRAGRNCVRSPRT